MHSILFKEDVSTKMYRRRVWNEVIKSRGGGSTFKASCHFLHQLHKGVLLSHMIIITNMMLAISVRSDQVSLFASPSSRLHLPVHCISAPTCLSLMQMPKSQMHDTHAHVEQQHFHITHRKKVSRQRYFGSAICIQCQLRTQWPCVPPRFLWKVRQAAPHGNVQPHSKAVGIKYTQKRPTGARFAFICDLTQWGIYARKNHSGGDAIIKYRTPFA